MGRNSRRIKDRATELAEGYEEARLNEFQSFACNEINMLDSIDEADIDFMQGILDSFTFPEENEWSLDQAENEYIDAQEQKYQEAKDDR